MGGEFRSMRICLVANYSSSVGGISSQVDMLYKNLRREGADVRLVSTKSSLFFKPLIFLRVLNTVRQYEILHVHGCSWFGFLPIIMGVAAGRLFRRKTIVTYHGGDAGNFLSSYGFFVKPFLRLADSITVPSSYLQDVFKKEGIDAVIIPNILDIERFTYVERKKLKPKFLIVKHLEAIYNVELGIRAFSIVKKHFPDAELRIVGSGSQENELKSLVKELGLSDSVVFLGAVDHRKIADIYKESDIFLNCSRIESFGMVILEAMASGLPVISTNVGGVSSIIKDGVNGFLVETGASDDMANRILYLLENPSVAAKISENGRKTAENYSWDNIRLSLNSIYQ